ncbi:hypothetical protein [Methylopila sp. M107]|uniref:hypothetical protein n=1 Tax=Methylopila sp. M107 TaxID=1101190 RepID=UPI000361AB08|nr:hypothetical protein [Methylopila sp. M107]
MAVLLEGKSELTEAESRIIAELVRQLRDVRPQNGGLWAKWSPLAIGAVLALFGAVLNNNLLAAREEQRTANARIDAIDGRSFANANAIDRIDRSVAAVDQWRKGADEELRAYRVALSEFRQLQGVTAEIGKKLDAGRDERLGDTARIIEGMSVQKTEIALLRQELQQLRRTLETRAEQPSRRSGRSLSAPSSIVVEAGVAGRRGP